MKNISYTLLIILGMLMTNSCKKYLTVNPRTEMPQDVLFSSENGFKDALSGVYIQMTNGRSYGAALTYSSVEYLISSWDVTSASLSQQTGLYNFSNELVEEEFDGIFAQQYRIISSANAILDKIDEKKDVFKTEGMYKSIKAECLAIRAYCHLDILRLYGPIPTAPEIGNKLPYVTNLSTNINELKSFDQFKVALLKDLTEAESLLKGNDDIEKYTITQLKTPGFQSGYNPDDTYLAYRYLRLNYYAIKGLQARAYLWFNDHTNAYECAKLVIDAKNENGTPKFRLGTSADLSTLKDYLFTSEHLFGLYNFDMYNKYQDEFASGKFKKGTAATTITGQLFGTTGTDIREAGLWELITLANQAKCYVIKKYQSLEKPLNISTDYKQIPMIRLSEMYLIAAEAAPLSEGQTYWETFRTSRNIPASVLPVDLVGRQFEIMKEFRKEFYAEGQSFYGYKRINAPKAMVLFTPTAANPNYLLPLPKTESIVQN